jgi:type II secretory pathway component GspD/PulD (secretin)
MVLKNKDMILTTVEKKSLQKIRKEINDLCTLNAIERLNTFYEEDIELRVFNIDNLISLLEQEREILNDLNKK